MKMTPEHHRAVAEVFAQSEYHDKLERALRYAIREGAGWRPRDPAAAIGRERYALCVFCDRQCDGHIANLAVCASCLREHAGPRWAIIAILRTPAVGENV